MQFVDRELPSYCKRGIEEHKMIVFSTATEKRGSWPDAVDFCTRCQYDGQIMSMPSLDELVAINYAHVQECAQLSEQTTLFRGLRLNEFHSSTFTAISQEECKTLFHVFDVKGDDLYKWFFEGYCALERGFVKRDSDLYNKIRELFCEKRSFELPMRFKPPVLSVKKDIGACSEYERNHVVQSYLPELAQMNAQVLQYRKLDYGRIDLNIPEGLVPDHDQGFFISPARLSGDDSSEGVSAIFAITTNEKAHAQAVHNMII